MAVVALAAIELRFVHQQVCGRSGLPANHQGSPTGRGLQAYLETLSFEPIASEGEDELDRKLLVDDLVAAIVRPSKSPLTIGLAGLASFGPGKLSSALDTALGNVAQEGPEELRERIGALLSSRAKSLVVLVDDADRIEAAELQALLRAVRIVSDLKGLTQVLAFDRHQLLFPDDPAGTRARDYLAKLVNLEVSLGAMRSLLLSRHFRPHAS